MSKRPAYKRVIEKRLTEMRAQVTESVNVADLKSAAEGLAGSTPALRTNTDTPRTDVVAKANYATQFEYSSAMTRHARELERELLAAVLRLGVFVVRAPLPASTNSAQVCRFDHGAAKKPKFIDPYIEGLKKLSNDEVMAKLRKHGCIGVKRVDEAKTEITEGESA